jgi:SAM-dependent methyltransferase
MVVRKLIWDVHGYRGDGDMARTPGVDARYDGLADWYDRFVTEATAYYGMVGAVAERLLGEGTGLCLDVGCGTGAHAALVRELGWRLVGLDISGDQLRVATESRRISHAVQARADRAPFVGACADAVLAVHIHTDVDDWEQVVREAARVLRPGGRLVYVGSHPCFIGSFAKFQQDGTCVLHPGYRERRLTFDGPGIGPHGVRTRVGERHVPLADLLMAVLHAGLRLDEIVEPGDGPLPLLLGFSATKPE